MEDYKIFLICVGVGICLGAFYGVVNFLKILLKKNIITNNVLSFLYALIFGAVVLIVIIEHNFGQFRLFLLLGFAFGVLIERKTIGKMFAKIYLWLYNKLCRAFCRLKKTKLVKKVLKWERKKL